MLPRWALCFLGALVISSVSTQHFTNLRVLDGLQEETDPILPPDVKLRGKNLEAPANDSPIVRIWANNKERKFEIDYEADTFLKDGEPFRYISGSLHYFRVPHQYWEDRMKKIKLLGFNTIQTYVEWSTHEPLKGIYNFEGDADIVGFVNLAAKHGFNVILRVGPYICAEREFGGYPAWLLTENPNMKFRTSDPSHTFFVEKWFKALFQRISPLLYGNGGPVILVQVENEYGSYPKHDVKYLAWLRDLLLSLVGDKAVLFTTDGWDGGYLDRGVIPNVFATVDFGSTSKDVMRLFKPLRSIQKHGPLVNSEFYTGWLTYWGGALAPNKTDLILRTMKEMIALNISFNCYMIHGGTNFGFTSGSSTSDILNLSLTSYDYGAPINESGDLTHLYLVMRELMKESGFDVGSDEEVKKLIYTPKGSYGTVPVTPVVPLLDSPIGKPHERTTHPKNMEYFKQYYGFIAYTHVVSGTPRDPSVLQVNIRDRAIVLLDKVEVSVLAYTQINETPLPPSLKDGMNLTLIVENEGRRNYLLLSDVTKGIVGNATFDKNTLEGWSTVSYPLKTEDIAVIEQLFDSGDIPTVEDYPLFFSANFTLPKVDNDATKQEVDETSNHVESTTFEIPMTESPTTNEARTKREAEQPNTGYPRDTFLDMSNWGKGVAFINGYNLGRYWHIGPTQTLYVPGVWLKPHPEINRITILELHFTNVDKSVRFITKPIMDTSEPTVRLVV